MNSACYRKEIFAEQVPLVYRFAMHLLHHRALSGAFAGRKFCSSFWFDTANAHILQAFIYWCMVFGNHDSNKKTHWKKLAVGSTDTLRISFRKGVCEHLRITEAEWDSYQFDMVTFRNKFVAHRDFAIPRPVPVLDRALEVAFFYDSWVRQLISPDILDVRPLREIYEETIPVITLEVASAVGASAAEPIVAGLRNKAAQRP